MSKFICLTEMPSKKNLLINSSIISFAMKGSKEDTYVKLMTEGIGNSKPSGNGAGSYLFVKESVEEIARKIEFDYKGPGPLLMTAEEYDLYTAKSRKANDYQTQTTKVLGG